MSFDKAKPAWTLPWEDGWVTAVSFVSRRVEPGGPLRLAAGNQHGQIFLWDLPEKPGGAAPAPVRRLDGHTNQVTRLLSSPDGRWLISASYDHAIRFWDLEAPSTGNAEVIMNSRAREAAAKRAGGKGPVEPPVKVELQAAARVLDAHKEWVQGLSASRDGKTLVSGDDGGNIIVWDREAGKELRRWKVKGWVTALALSPEGNTLLAAESIPVYGQRYRAAKLHDAATGQVQRDLVSEFKQEEFAAAAFSPDGKLLYLGQAGEGNGKLWLVDVATGKKLREMPGHQYGVTEVRFSNDGRFVLSSGRDTTIKVYQASDGKSVATLGTPRGGQFKDWYHGFTLSADEKWLAAADMAGHVQVWAVA